MATARRRLIIGFIVPSIVVAVFMHATAAQASPTITVSSPPAGQPLYDLRPTITVGYTSDDPAAPLNLATLRVTVNGFDWTGKFTAGPDSATYAVTVDDELIAGILTIAASISDTAGASASTAADYDVFPTLSALAPSTAEAGDTISLMASGLDPAPDRNKALLTPSGLTAALSDVDRSIATGRFTLPAGTTTGDVGLEVNGKVARERIQLSVPSVVPNCGGIRSLFATADGGWLVAYGADPFKPVDPQCPPAQLVDYLKWRFVKVTPAGELLPLPLPGGVGLGFDVRLIPNKRRSDAAILKRNFSLPVVVRYKDIDTFLSGWVFAADFDRDGNLFVVFYNGGFRIYRVSKEALAQGGDATLGEPIAQLPVQFGSLEPYGFVVSCDGFAYAVVNLQLNNYPWVQPRIFKVDLAARAVVGDRLLGVGEELHNLALSCQTNELWSVRSLNIQEDSSAAIARTEVTPNGFGISEDVFVTPAAAYPIGVAIGAGGSLYFQTGTNAILAKRGAINACPVPTGALPVCETPEEAIVILPSTTRWKPQKSDDPVKVEFAGPKDLKPTTMLEIKDPSGAIVALQPPPTLSVDPSDATHYSLTWSGPWTRQTGGKTERLSAGNYTFVVKGVNKDGSPIESVPSAPCKGATAPSGGPPPPSCSIVSLVEVTALKFQTLAGAPALPTNLGPGGGSAILAEATQQPTTTDPNPEAFDKLAVVASIDPAVPDPRDQGPVKAYFRALDVDDPSASGKPVDDESQPADNRADADAALGILVTDPATGALVFQALAPIGGVLQTDVVDAGQSSETTRILRVSPRQGDNYRVAASTSAEWLSSNNLVVEQNTPRKGPDGSLLPPGWVDDGNGKPLDPAFERVGLTEMLTVWRTLHVEVDALVSQSPAADQAAMDLRGQGFTMLTRDRLIDNSGAFFTLDHPKADDWVGANLSVAFHAGDWYDVTSNQQTVATVKVGIGQPPLHDNLKPPAIMALQDKSYIVRDDEIGSLDASKSCGPTKCVADYALTVELLAKAYISLVPVVQASVDSAIPFTMTPGSPSTDRRNLIGGGNYALPAELRSAKTFWNTQLVSAFDGDAAQDLDPQTEAGFNLGLTTIGRVQDGSFKYKSSIFLETIRDLYEKPPATIKPRASQPPVTLRLSPEVTKRVTAHEMLHTLGLIHDDAIMCGGINVQNIAIGGTITDKQLVTLRSVDEPSTKPDPNTTCP